MKTLSWKPVRRGEFYCSPACGGRCTVAAFKQAQRNGKGLAARLGNGWTWDVWENIGWYYKAVSPCGRIKLHCHGATYNAYLGDPDSAGGTWATSGRTPELAVRAVIRIAKADLKTIGAILKGL